MRGNGSYRKLPWSVRFAIAADDAGWTLPSWLQLSVAMSRDAGGCSSCRR